MGRLTGWKGSGKFLRRIALGCRMIVHFASAQTVS
jgi:hypothetical protein